MDTEKFKMGWLVVAFDLPVVEKEQRKAATDFREYLLDDGYTMMQFSVLHPGLRFVCPAGDAFGAPEKKIYRRKGQFGRSMSRARSGSDRSSSTASRRRKSPPRLARADSALVTSL